MFFFFLACPRFNSNVFNINMASSTGKIFLPHLEKESQPSGKKLSFEF
jgi:hypothetical protein